MERVPESCRYCDFFMKEKPACQIGSKEWAGLENADTEKSCSAVLYDLVRKLDDELASIQDLDEQYETYLKKYGIVNNEFMEYRKETIGR